MINTGRQQSFKLSVCVPSRNRQEYFKKTISELLASPRQDVDFVFADNSDEPGIMNTFMQQYADDPRVTYVPADSGVHSLMANWERACRPARGDYVCLIGDDDYMDVDAVDVITRLESEGKKPDVIGWSRPVYYWPENDVSGNLCVELNSYCGFVPKQILWDRAILWKDHTIGIPHYPFTIYHNAVSRQVIEKVRSSGDGNMFHNPLPDIDFGLKLLLHAETFAYSARPYTVAGICKASAGSSYGSVKRIKEIHNDFFHDLGRHSGKDPHLKDFPFPSHIGNTIVIAQTHIWFRQTFGIVAPGWEENFVDACSESCAYWKSDDDYRLVVAEFRKAFALWKGGRYAKRFRPPPRVVSATSGLLFLGTQIAIKGDGTQRYSQIWIEDVINGASTPGAFFDTVKGMLPAADQLDYMLDVDKQPIRHGFRS